MATINGTNGADTLTGTTENDEVNGFDGGDRLSGGGGDDTLNGGAGNDFLDGRGVSASEMDVLIGGPGNDEYVVDGNDRIVELATEAIAGEGIDTVYVARESFVSDQAIEHIRPLNDFGTTPLVLRGNIYTISISGNNGNNYLANGAVGNQDSQVLIGRLGDDTYEVTGSRVNVVERSNEGFDTIIVQDYAPDRNFALQALSEIEILRAQGGTAPINITGNEFSQQVIGNDGANIINGGGVSSGDGDTLIGLGGNDTYLVQSRGDVVVEGNGGGADIVYTTISYNLGSNEVEALSTVDNSATTAINLIGNFVSQTIVGNFGNNILNGGSGADTLIGLRGNDLYAVGDSRIVIREAAGEGDDTVVTSVDYALGAGVSVEVLSAQDRGSTTGLVLTGNGFGQTIAGTAGADTLNGGGGNDVLIGGTGADRFAFTTTLSSGNVDAIADFQAGTDRIGLASDVFAGIGATFDAGEFTAGTAAADADDRIIYNSANGQILYDADGNGSGAAVLFALVTPGTALTAASFEVIAPVATAT